MQLLNTRRLPHNATVTDLIEVLKEFHPHEKVDVVVVGIDPRCGSTNTPTKKVVVRSADIN